MGTLRSIRRKVYERLKAYREELRNSPPPIKNDLLPKVDSLIDILYRCPLKEGARDTLSRQLKLGIPDEDLVRLVSQLYEDDRLCQVIEKEGPVEPQILCSLGLREG
jgi:hypothetical protein